MYTELFSGAQEADTSIDERYVLVPSTLFSTEQPQMAEEFQTFRQSVAKVLPDTTFTTGEARIQNGTVVKLTLTVSAYGKTIGEILAVIQTVRERLDVFQSQDCLYKVVIKNNGDICALLDRDPGSTSVQVLTVY